MRKLMLMVALLILVAPSAVQASQDESICIKATTANGGVTCTPVSTTYAFPASPQYQYVQIGTSTQVKTSPGELGTIFVSSVSGSPTITVYDTPAMGTSTPIVAQFIPSAATTYNFNYATKTGLYVTIGSTVNATVGFQ